MSNPKSDDIKFMKEAMLIAESMAGRTSPDPMVGAVLVLNGKIISRGYHAEVATPHAEAFAIKKAGKKAKGSTLYVNLEPCCHYGNNPPCTNRIIKAGIKKVVAAMKDPNPFVCGKGFKMLKKAGIKVEVGALNKEALKLNEAFIKYITKRVPFVILKSAMTLDGKIATKTGDAFWITGQAARDQAHYLRSIVDAVIVGVGTVIRDDPELTIRNIKLTPERKKKNPVRIILDPNCRTPLNSKVLNTKKAQTIIVTKEGAPHSLIREFKRKGAEILEMPTKNGLVDLVALMQHLGRKHFTCVLIEGGGTVNASAISAGIVDKVEFFIAPKIIGGKDAKTPVEGEGIKQISKAVKLRDVEVKKVGEDILIEGYIKN